MLAFAPTKDKKKKGGLGMSIRNDIVRTYKQLIRQRCTWKREGNKTNRSFLNTKSKTASDGWGKSVCLVIESSTQHSFLWFHSDPNPFTHLSPSFSLLSNSCLFSGFFLSFSLYQSVFSPCPYRCLYAMFCFIVDFFNKLN